MRPRIFRDPVDYSRDSLAIEQIPDWGDRPVWSPDNNRAVVRAGPGKGVTSPMSCVEMRDFVDDGKAAAFATPGKSGPPHGAMYKPDIASGRAIALPRDGQHNVTHSFPDAPTARRGPVAYRIHRDRIAAYLRTGHGR